MDHTRRRIMGLWFTWWVFRTPYGSTPSGMWPFHVWGYHHRRYWQYGPRVVGVAFHWRTIADAHLEVSGQ